ncbi:MAG: hypothetical protein QNK91_10995 [Parasphingorhabdus sp.]|jgi:hypothetical protein
MTDHPADCVKVDLGVGHERCCTVPKIVQVKVGHGFVEEVGPVLLCRSAPRNM